MRPKKEKDQESLKICSQHGRPKKAYYRTNMLKFGFPASHYFAIVNIMFKLVIQTINLILFAFILLLGFSLFFASFFVCEGKGCNFSKYIRPKSYPTGQALESQMHFYPVYRSSQRLVLFNAPRYILTKTYPIK